MWVRLMAATAVTSLEAISQRANWRSVMSATSTLLGARNVASCVRYRRMVLTSIGVSVARSAHSRSDAEDATNASAWAAAMVMS
jgi:hypothetical protein